jgi:hypothetical protein
VKTRFQAFAFKRVNLSRYAPDAVDPAVNVTLCVVLFLFSAEFLLNCACRDKYPFSFFFWMDLLGTFSIIADVPWLSDGGAARVEFSLP